MPIKVYAENRVRGSAEKAIRTAWEALPSIQLKTWYPLSVTVGGRTANFLACRVKVDSSGKKNSTLHILQLRLGRLLTGDAPQPLAYRFQLTGSDVLKVSGPPSKATEEEKSLWAKQGFKVTSSVETAAPGRQLPGAYPGRGQQIDQVTLLQKLGLTQAEFVFLCGMIRTQILKDQKAWPFQPKE